MSFKIIGIGEVLWDLLPSGPQLGGAPANFACHAHALGAQAAVVTRVGNDSFGRTIQQRFKRLGIADGTMQVDDEAPTGTVTISLSGNGIPHFTIHEPVAWDHLIVTPSAITAVQTADAICFGTLAQRHKIARDTIQKLVATASPKTLRIFDINLRQNYFSPELIEQSLQLANVLKLNDGELAILARLFNLNGSPRGQLELLASKFDLHVIALTRGPAGSLIFRDGQWSDCPSVPITVVDTVGAGDAFAAALVMGLLHEFDLDQINILADEVARYVCSFDGATPPLSKIICDRFVVPPSCGRNMPELIQQVRT
jgi:fructokinase